MDFKQEQPLPKNEHQYHMENLRATRTFTKKLLEEMNDLVRSVVLFGSNTQNTLNKDSDIDIMIVLNNVSVFVTPELKEAYQIITKRLTQDISDKFHILTINLSDLWDMARKGDPILVNILRFGMPIFDRDLIEPMQYLLETGKIRPTKESIDNYSARASTLLEESNFHIKEALMDLYYAVIDQAHATLMIHNVLPPSPKEMPKIFRETFKDKKTLGKYSNDIEEFYTLSKELEHKSGTLSTGSYYDTMRKKAQRLISALHEYNSKELKNKTTFDL
jgi:predicted nucleotidyltransferase